MRDIVEMLDTVRVTEDRRWQERANCLGVDPDLFFPERGASTKEAKGVCGGCEGRTPGLEEHPPHREEVRSLGGKSEPESQPIPRLRALPRGGPDSGQLR